MTKRSDRLLAVALCALLAACGSSEDVKESLGLNRQAPDEFQVVSRPPLSIPPEFSLRPPGKGEEYSSGQPAAAKARNVVLGNSQASGQIGVQGTPTVPAVSVSASPASPDAAIKSPLLAPPISITSTAAAVPLVSTSNLPSSADAQFLSDIGATKANPDIREQIDQDKLNGPALVKNSGYLLGDKKESEAVVDPDKEARRLKQDKDQNKPPTEGGETPVIAPQSKGILGGIF